MLKESLYPVKAGFGVEPLPSRLLQYMLILCMLHPCRRRWGRRWGRRGCRASPFSRRITILILFRHFYLPSFILSLSKHFIRSRTSIYIEAPTTPHPEHWFLIPDSWLLTAAPHLIIHEMQKLGTKSELFFISVVFVPHGAVKKQSISHNFFLSFFKIKTLLVFEMCK